jgi:uncharacterized protein YprB with RNaseH-like and TPR domain/predicted RNA-binding Zn-ribbon protein involved in translation (DUF1610 family)
LTEEIERQPKILYFDIETTNLSAGFGVMLMFAYCWHNDRDNVKVETICNYSKSFQLSPEKADLYLVKSLTKLINEADIVVAHFGGRFDVPFLRTRCLVHGLHIPKTKWKNVFDTWMIAKKQLRFTANSLKCIAKGLGVENQKDELPLYVWQWTQGVTDTGYFRQAIEEMADYCKQDVRTLYDIAQLLRPLAKHLPSFAAITGAKGLVCPNCGSLEVEYKGVDAGKSTAYFEYQCKKCGNWFRGVENIRKIPKEERTMY